MQILSNIRICVRLVSDVIAYRIRKREMANLFAALSIMIALHNEKFDIFYRIGFAFVLNILVYLINDFCDIDIDIHSTARDRDKVLFLKSHKKQAFGSMLVMFILLLVWAFLYYPGLFLSLIGGSCVCWLYSARLKRTPFADIFAMILWGGLMPTAGIFLDSVNGWLLVLQLALFSSCFETIQTLRDRESDGRLGMKTTAVFLGEQRTKILLRALIFLTAMYCIFMLHKLFGLFLLVAILIPVSSRAMDTYWNRIRLIFGLVWLAVLVQFYLFDSPAGLIYDKLLHL